MNAHLAPTTTAVAATRAAWQTGQLTSWDLAASVANDCFHGALSNIVRILFRDPRVTVTPVTIRVAAVRIVGGYFGRDAGEREDLSDELWHVASMLERGDFDVNLCAGLPVWNYDRRVGTPVVTVSLRKLPAPHRFSHYSHADLCRVVTWMNTDSSEADRKAALMEIKYRAAFARRMSDHKDTAAADKFARDDLTANPYALTIAYMGCEESTTFHADRAAAMRVLRFVVAVVDYRIETTDDRDEYSILDGRTGHFSGNAYVYAR